MQAASRRAPCAQLAVGAVGIAGRAAGASMANEPVAEIGPCFPRKQLRKIGFHFDRIRVAGKSQPAREPSDVGVHNDAGIDAKGVAKHDIGGFATDTRQGGQGFQIGGDLPAVPVNQCCRHSPDVFCLVAKEARAADEVFQLLLRNVRIVLNGGAALKQAGRDKVYPFVSALGRENGRHKKLQRIFKMECTVRVRVNGRQSLEKDLRAFGPCQWSKDLMSLTVRSVAPRWTSRQAVAADAMRWQSAGSLSSFSMTPTSSSSD